jgi:hypothetical protein
VAGTLPATTDVVFGAVVDAAGVLAPAAVLHALTARVAHSASGRIRVRTLRNRFMPLTVRRQAWKNLGLG